MQTVKDADGRKYKVLASFRGAVPPWKEGNAAYPLVYDVVQFCKRKRNRQSVILAQNYFPCACSHCGKTIFCTDPNRADIFPHSKKFRVYHYKCAWEQVFNTIYGKMYDAVMGR